LLEGFIARDETAEYLVGDERAKEHEQRLHCHRLIRVSG
jgi:hypothetical protein